MLTGLLGILSPVLDKVLAFIPNPVERAKAQLEFTQHLQDQEQELIKLFVAQDQAQTDVNKVEASSTSLFVSGWRPGVGWVCTAGVAWSFVVKPLLDWVLAIVAPGVHTPVIASGDLLNLLLGLLGMGALRSYDKMKGTASK